MTYDWEGLFNAEEKRTYGETLGPAMDMTDPEEAKAFKAAYVSWMVRTQDIDEEEATDLVNQNLGYYAGYYDHETRLRVEELFECSHPVFGSAEDGPPDSAAAFAAGKLLGAEEES